MLGTTKLRWTAIAMLATTSLLTLAPAAHADRGRSRGAYRYKGAPVVRVEHHGPRYVVRDHSAGPLIAGLVGGFVLGSVINSAPRRVEYVESYRYYDPYEDCWYDTMDSYWNRSRRHHHPHVLRVVSVRSGECVRVIRWNDGRWNDCDRDEWRAYDRGGRWNRGDDRYDGRYDNDRYDDRYDNDRGDDRDMGRGR